MGVRKRLLSVGVALAATLAAMGCGGSGAGTGING